MTNKVTGGNQYKDSSGLTHYQRNKSYYIKRNNDRRKMLSQKINEYKDSYPCKDCGTSYPSYVMDFDHLSDKEYSIGNMPSSGYSWESILKEIKKCEVVCSNCHRERTYQRRIALLV